MILNVDRSPPEHAVHSTGSWGVGASAGPATEGLNRDFPDASQILKIVSDTIRVGKGLTKLEWRNIFPFKVLGAVTVNNLKLHVSLRPP